MQFRQSPLIKVAVLAALTALVPALAQAEPQPPSEEENADVAFAASFVGRTYDGELDIEGWNDLGGGLIVAPIYIHQYQRADGTFLVRRPAASSPRNRAARPPITRWPTH